MNFNFIYKLQYALSKMIAFLFRLGDIGVMHPMRTCQKRALARTVDYIEKNMNQAIAFQTRADLIKYAINQMDRQGQCLEFGVASGATLRHIAQLLSKRNCTQPIHGFDSFQGLPENWSGGSMIKGTFSRNKLPKLPKNVLVHQGLFSDTLPIYREQYPQKIAFMHIDCDLYSSTTRIFQNLATQIDVGTLILFDEYFNYPNWESGEFKAWQEFCRQYDIGYDYLGYAYTQVLIRVTQKKYP